MSADFDADETANDGDEPYLNPHLHPANHVAPIEVAQAMAALSEDEVEQMNQADVGEDPEFDDADRVLVSLDADLAEWIQKRAWEFGEDPNELVDAFVKHGNYDYERALGMQE